MGHVPGLVLFLGATLCPKKLRKSNTYNVIRRTEKEQFQEIDPLARPCEECAQIEAPKA
jgi:hypothetical protein